MNPTQKLLIILLGDPSQEEIELLLSEHIDWSFFIRAAKNNGVIPLIFKRLWHFLSKLPVDISSELQNLAQNISMRNLNFNVQLAKIAKIFEANNINFLFYKGAALAQLAYGDPSLRQFGDLDILIYKQDFPQVKRLMLEHGGKPYWNLSAKQEKAVLKYYYEFPFKFGEHTSVLVEMHWALMESFFAFDYNSEEIFRRSQSITVYGKTFPTFSNEDLLLYLCVHGSKHFWQRLSWICDVGKLVQTQPIRWQTVISLAKESGCLRMLKLGLQLAKDALQINLPDIIQSEIEKDKKVQSLAAELKNQLFSDTFSAGSMRTDIHLKMRERWRDKFTYSHRLFTTKLVDSLFMPMGRPR